MEVKQTEDKRIFSGYTTKNGKGFVALYGNWKWLNEDKPKKVNWICNENGGKACTAEETEIALIERCIDNTFYANPETLELIHGELFW